MWVRSTGMTGKFLQLEIDIYKQESFNMKITLIMVGTLKDIYGELQNLYSRKILDDF